MKVALLPEPNSFYKWDRHAFLRCWEIGRGYFRAYLGRFAKYFFIKGMVHVGEITRSSNYKQTGIHFKNAPPPYPNKSHIIIAEAGYNQDCTMGEGTVSVMFIKYHLSE